MQAATPRRSRRLGWAAVLVLSSTLVALGGAEYLARRSGHRPRVPESRPEPPIHVPDAVLGWRPVPGQYRFGPYAPSGRPVEVTIRPDGSRETGSGPSAGRPQVVLIGCSFTMGWAVSDDETWAWRLQELRRDLKIVNDGVGGYGTLQSSLLLERHLAEGSRRPVHVLYGFDPVPGEVHPDAAAHRRWGECVATALEAPGRLPPPSTATPPSGTDRR
jgi:hypothetical protein